MDKLSEKDKLEILTFAMSFGHEPTPKETLDELLSAGYDIVKFELNKESATCKESLQVQSNKHSDHIGDANEMVKEPSKP